MNYLIGVDFSIAKPAACAFDGKNYIFYSWVKNLSDRLMDLYKGAGIEIRKRDHFEMNDLVRNDLINANILSDLIIGDLKNYMSNSTIFIFEGASFASKGNQLISLTAWRYILMQRLFNAGVKWENMTTYAPITIKKTAGCSEKGKTKKEMIDAFIASGKEIPLRNALARDPSLFQKKTGTWIDHLDDLVDAFWAVETYREKN